MLCPVALTWSAMAEVLSFLTKALKCSVFLSWSLLTIEKRNISLVAYCLSLHFLANQISCRSYFGSVYRIRSLIQSSIPGENCSETSPLDQFELGNEHGQIPKASSAHACMKSSWTVTAPNCDDGLYFCRALCLKDLHEDSEHKILFSCSYYPSKRQTRTPSG